VRQDHSEVRRPRGMAAAVAAIWPTKKKESGCQRGSGGERTEETHVTAPGSGGGDLGHVQLALGCQRGDGREVKDSR
jgi:hypothetical protein